MLGVQVSRDPFRYRSQTLSAAKYTIASYRRSCSNQSDPGRLLHRTFSIHILQKDDEDEPDIEDFLVAKKDNVFDETDEITESDDAILKLKPPRFGIANYETIISNNMLAQNDPFSWEPLQSQVAGHGIDTEGKASTVPGVLITSEGQILKPVQESRGVQRGLTEVAFYSHIMQSKDLKDLEIKKWVPKFFGIEQFESDADGILTVSNFLVLEDITAGFELPVVMDIKIGKIVYGPDASPEKKARANNHSWPTRDPLGFKVSGLLAHSLKPEDEDQLNQDGNVYSKKSFGQKLTPETVSKVPETFYNFEFDEKIQTVNDMFVKKLKSILKVFEDQSQYHIYGSSLLFTYDANAVRKFRKGKLSIHEFEPFLNIKLIDFANVYESDGEKDENFTRGLRNVISIFENFSSKGKQR